MIGLLSLAMAINHLWYAAPLIVTISLVYGATRHEMLWPILEHSIRTAVWMVGFIAVIFAILFVISWLL